MLKSGCNNRNMEKFRTKSKKITTILTKILPEF